MTLRSPFLLTSAPAFASTDTTAIWPLNAAACSADQFTHVHRVEICTVRHQQLHDIDVTLPRSDNQRGVSVLCLHCQFDTFMAVQERSHQMDVTESARFDQRCYLATTHRQIRRNCIYISCCVVRQGFGAAPRWSHVVFLPYRRCCCRLLVSHSTRVRECLPTEWSWWWLCCCWCWCLWQLALLIELPSVVSILAHCRCREPSAS